MATPKKQAEKLFNRILNNTNLLTDKRSSLAFEHARQCAIIAVEEIIIRNTPDFPISEYDTKPYWNEVIKHLNKFKWNP